MKKMMKLSLVAAVAVAGLSTSASAKSMEEAIKNVDLSGYVRYRYTQPEVGMSTNEYKIQATLKSKVNDNVTAQVSILNENAAGDAAGGAKTSDTTGDADPRAARIVEANFAITKGALTVIAGKQALATPFADGDLDSQQGTGAVALYKVNEGLTLAGGLFINSDAKAKALSSGVAADLGAHNIAAIAAIGKAGMVSYAAWYANIEETDLGINNGASYAGIDAGAQAINLNLKATFGIASVELTTLLLTIVQM
jgi:hypothetical protein